MNTDDFLNLAKKYNLYIENVSGTGTYVLKYQYIVSLAANSQCALMALVDYNYTNNPTCVVYDGAGTAYNDVKKAEKALTQEIIKRKKQEIAEKLSNIDKDFSC